MNLERPQKIQIVLGALVVVGIMVVIFVNQSLSSTNTNGNVWTKQNNNSTSIITSQEQATCPPFANQWCPRTTTTTDHDDAFCYRRGNNWKECAGDHLLYPPSTKSELLSRKVMCLYEPLCWLQLDDWRETDPPAWHCSSCKNSKNLRFVDWGLHDGTMASLTSILRNGTQFDHMDVINCNVKGSKNAERNYHYQFANCPTKPSKIQHTWLDYPTSDKKHGAAESFYEWAKTDAFGQSVDVHMISFVPSMFEVLMALNKTLILNFLHRNDLARCSRQASHDNFQNLMRLASSGPTGNLTNGPLHIVAPGYIHDVEYVRHYTGIQPVYLPVSLLEVLPKNSSYTGTKSEFIYNAHYKLPSVLAESQHTFWSPARYELADLMQYRAVLHLPYSITNMKILEQYEMSIPIFAPTPQFALELGLFDDRTTTYDPYCSRADYTDAKHEPAHPTSPYEFSPNARQVHGDPADNELFWISFAEIYRWPCVQYFTSWQHLLEQLDQLTDAQLQETSRCMKQANKWRKYEVDTMTCWILEQLSDNHVGNRTLREDLDYQQTLRALYGTDTLFTA